MIRPEVIKPGVVGTGVVEPVRPASIGAPLARYSHAVTFPGAAKVLVTSGQLALAADGSVPDDAEQQCELIFRALGAILEEAGFSWTNVAKFTAYVTDRAYFPVYGAVRARHVPGDAFASTLLVVSGFTRPEFKVEVEIIAVQG